MEKRHYFILAFLLAFLTIPSYYLYLLIPKGSKLEAADIPAREISSQRYFTHVNHLASDRMRGRGNGSTELEIAADYVAAQFRIRGLQPGGENGSYFQTLDVITNAEIGNDNELLLGTDALQFKEDFQLMRFSTALEVTAPLVFVGYGITAPEMHWDDYREIDVTDKIVVAFRHEPQEMDASSPFDGTEMTSHASFMNKTINAKRHGAKAIIFIMDPNNHTPDEEALRSTTARSEKGNSGIAAAYVRSEPVLSYFKQAGYSLGDIQREIDTELESKSFELEGSEAHLVSNVTRVHSTIRNVIGAIPGTNPKWKNEWIILGAHYDHLGLGNEYSMERSAAGRIHNGADDNASGTAGILELARVISENRTRLDRSVLFIAFAGEELGLFGSNHFVNYPTIDLEHVVAMLNFDMIGRLNNNRVFIGGVGTSPNFTNLLTSFNEAIDLTLDYSESGSGSSDHTSFNIKKIPVLFFFSGLHGDYHRPSDTAEKINAEGARNVLMLAYNMIDHLAGDIERPLYSEVFEERPLRGSGGGYGPYFGSIPDFRDDLAGVLFADVRVGSPAGKAGLVAGDLLVEFGGQKIQNLYDFTYALRAHKPGDIVVVVIERKGQTISAEILLEARR